jgi:hypothetical protein
LQRRRAGVSDPPAERSRRTVAVLSIVGNTCPLVQEQSHFKALRAGDDVASVLAGMNAARGEAVVVMDDDLQHAPADIPVSSLVLRSCFIGFEQAAGAGVSEANLARRTASRFRSARVGPGAVLLRKRSARAAAEGPSWLACCVVIAGTRNAGGRPALRLLLFAVRTLRLAVPAILNCCSRNRPERRPGHAVRRRAACRGGTGRRDSTARELRQCSHKTA